jgi:stringent starvation protein B
MDVEQRPPKKDAFLAFLKEGWVWVHLDARHPGVSVPAELAQNPRLVLQYGYNMPIPIPDLAVDERGITATLSFSRMPHRTFVPWSAVYIVSCTDGRGVVYFEDVPEDVALLGAPASRANGRPSEVVAAAPGEAVPEATDLAAAPNGADQPKGPRPGRNGRAARARSSLAQAPDGRPTLAVVPPGPQEDDLELPARVAHARRRRPRLRLVK